MSSKVSTLRLAVCALATASLTSGCATRLDVEVGAGSPYAGLKVEGSAIDVTLINSGRRKAKRVVLPCSYFDKAGSTLATGLVYFDNLRAGGRSTNRVILATPKVARGACRLR